MTKSKSNPKCRLARPLTNDRQIQSLARDPHIITKHLDAPDTKHARILAMLADASRRYDRSDHDGHGMAAAFSARLSRRRCSQEARFESFFRIDVTKAGSTESRIARLRPGLPIV